MTDPFSRSAPAVEITLETTLKGILAKTLLRHADRRKVEPVDLLASIIEAVLNDDIVDAVLDDEATA